MIRLAPPADVRLVSLTREVLSYFDNRDTHLAPSEIDVVMGLRQGTSHDLIVRWWYRDLVDATS